MARAETIETVGESTGGGGGGGNGLLPRHNASRLPCPLHSWHRVLITTTGGTGTGTGVPYLHRNHHHLDPLLAIYLPYPLPYTHSGSQDEPETHHQSPALSPAVPLSPLLNQQGESSRRAAAPGDPSGEQPDPDRENPRNASSRRGPLPDLLPQNEHVHRASQRGSLRGEAVQEMELRRVAQQLKVIGDEFNATVLRRAHIAPHWRDWRDVCRGLLSFIAQTLSTLYRLT